jgi:cell division topological specificity factor
MAGLSDRAKNKSASTAKERLQLVLVHDRTALTPKAVDSMKNDLLDVISRYIEIDPEAVQIELKRDGRHQSLIADIPLKPAARSRVG